MGESTRRATRERHDTLVALVRSGTDSVETLAQRVGVSTSTVRRDLTQLQRSGRIARTYGGAIARDEFQELSFGESEQLHREQKARIAAAAAAFVTPGSTVFLDAGTTCLAVARCLEQRAPLDVVTRGLEAALLLARSPGLSVEILGGTVRPLSHGVVGALSSIGLDRMHFDVAFLGADVVDPARGLGEPTLEETWVKEQAAARADRVVLVADSSKLSGVAVPAWLPWGQHWRLVTDAAIPEPAVAEIRGRAVEVTVAD